MATSNDEGIMSPSIFPVGRVSSRVISGGSSEGKASGLRKGKWTSEEEAYCNKVIYLFNRGLLPIPTGTTLRSYLSDKLNCDPMRITKKYSGASCIGKQVFQPAPQEYIHEMQDHEEELLRLEIDFKNRLGKKLLSSIGSSPRQPRINRGGKIIDGGSNYDDDDDEEMEEDSFEIKDDTNRNIGILKSISAPNLLYTERNSMSPHSGRIVVFRNSVKVSKRHRSQSAADFVDYENYTSDDAAAGDLLISFMDTMKRKTSSDSLDKMGTAVNEMKVSSPSTYEIHSNNTSASEEAIVMQLIPSYEESNAVGLSMDTAD
jgi:hypothetical protein